MPENMPSILRYSGYGSELAAGAALVIWPDKLWIAYLLFFAGLVLILWPLFVWLFSWAANLLPGQIPLSEAALVAYEKTQQTAACRMAEMERDGDGVLEWYATALLNRGGIKLFGKKPPMRKRREINSDILNRGTISEGGKSFTFFNDRTPTYFDLAIKKSDMKKQIKEIATWG